MSLLKRFAFAFAGIYHLLVKDKNFRLHGILFLVLLAFGFYFHISVSEWIAVLICSALVLSLEAINTAIEHFADHLHPERHEQIKIVKDVSSGAVTLAAIFSAIVAALVFFPKIYASFSS